MMSYGTVKLKKGISLNEFLSRYDTRVVSGDLSCFHGACTADCTQEGIMVDGGVWIVPTSAGPKWRSATSGAECDEPVRFGTKYLQRHQSGVGYRYHLSYLVRKTAWMALRTPPMPKRLLELGLS